jgi:hypothetical protein
MVAAGVIFFCRYDATLLAGVNAKMTFLAKFLVDYNITFQNRSSKMVQAVTAIILLRKLSCAK